MKKSFIFNPLTSFYLGAKKLYGISFKVFTFKGFTLVELLVVIAILGILAVGLVVAIDPMDKLNASRDARVLSDFGVIARAAEAYATTHNAIYPNTLTLDIGSFEDQLKTIPTAPSTYLAYNYVGTPPNCDTTSSCTNFRITSQLKSKKHIEQGGSTADPKVAFLRYESELGKTCIVPIRNTQLSTSGLVCL